MKNKHAVAMGRLGGSAKSEKKTMACRMNGKKGGRPKKSGKIFLDMKENIKHQQMEE